MPKKLLNPEEVASILQVDPADVTALIEERTLRAYIIRGVVRIAEDDLERCLEACATLSSEVREKAPVLSGVAAISQKGEWDSRTFAGRTTFRVSGHVDIGARIWPGNMRYPIIFPKDKFEAILAYGRSRGEMRVGLSFSGPEAGSLGQWIQENLPTKLNPACYVAGLLIEEGYAERVRAGVIRFFPKRRV